MRSRAFRPALPTPSHKEFPLRWKRACAGTMASIAGFCTTSIPCAVNENLVLREEIEQVSMFEEIVGFSPAIQKVLARVAKVAATDATVLVTGETGTGKELIARAIHKRSSRASRAFVSVNCAA